MVCTVAFAPSFASCAFHVPDVPSFVSLLVSFHSSIVHLPFSETYHPIQPGTGQMWLGCFPWPSLHCSSSLSSAFLRVNGAYKPLIPYNVRRLEVVTAYSCCVEA